LLVRDEGLKAKIKVIGRGDMMLSHLGSVSSPVGSILEDPQLLKMLVGICGLRQLCLLAQTLLVISAC